MKHHGRIDDRRDYSELQNLGFQTQATSNSKATLAKESKASSAGKDDFSSQFTVGSEKLQVATNHETRIPAFACSQDVLHPSQIRNTLLKSIAFELRSVDVGPTIVQLGALADNVPTTGTNLDIQWALVLQALIQLFLAANNKSKHHYIPICSGLLHHATELITLLESAEMKISSSSLDYQVRSRIKECTMSISPLLPKQLMFSTMISVCPGEQREAVESLLDDALKITKLSKDAVGIANLLGVFPIVDRPIEILVILI